MSCLFYLGNFLQQTSDKDLEIAMPKKKGQTMVDQFQEALGATFLNDKPQG